MSQSFKMSSHTVGLKPLRAGIGLLNVLANKFNGLIFLLIFLLVCFLLPDRQVCGILLFDFLHVFLGIGLDGLNLLHFLATLLHRPNLGLILLPNLINLILQRPDFRLELFSKPIDLTLDRLN